MSNRLLLHRRAALALALSLTCVLGMAGLARAADLDSYAAPGPFRVEVSDTTWTDVARQRPLPLRIRLPAADGARPVVLFSHGLGGSVDGGRFWGEHWASHGFVVIHLQHPGSDTAVWQDAARPARELKRAASREQFNARVLDVKFVLDELQRRQRAGDAFALRIDLARVGMSGHSFGAVTTQALAGQRFDVPARLRAQADALADDRLRAFIAFSPSARTDDAVSQFRTITRPFFSVTGTEDGLVGLGLGVPAPRRLLPFEGMPGPDAYLLILDGADHMIFNGAPRRRTDGTDPARDAQHVRLTQATTIAFWRAHLLDDPEARRWLRTSAETTVRAAGQFRVK
jgi:predicted dienelactone hydrolase